MLGELLPAPIGQEDVGGHEIEMAVVLGAQPKSFARGGRMDHGVALRGEDAMSGDAQRMLVVDHKDRALPRWDLKRPRGVRYIGIHAKEAVRTYGWRGPSG